ncbi:MAG: antitoxin family protein [Pyrinomonadaceae bacterium]
MQRLKAIYQNGAFVPQTPCDLPENSEVELTIHDSSTIQPEITDPAERARIMKEIIQSMLGNPIPGDAPRFTREELHERR